VKWRKDQTRNRLECYLTGMNVGLFGGTFDPIHRGHLAVARAARQQFNLKQIFFVPAAVPPHKPGVPITEFEHRYAMMVLATAGEKSFLPSLLEAPRATNLLPFRDAKEAKLAPNYTISTVRRLRLTLRARDKLFFILGIDSFLQIANWREPEALLEEAEVIIAPRPGYSMADIAGALPSSIRPSASALKIFRKKKPQGTIKLPGATLHLLAGVHERVSSTAIRRAATGKGSLERYVGAEVADYIRKQKLYREFAP
jgi:nicotinate-nucleotide adenylyltransferase